MCYLILFIYTIIVVHNPLYAHWFYCKLSKRSNFFVLMLYKRGILQVQATKSRQIRRNLVRCIVDNKHVHIQKHHSGPATFSFYHPIKRSCVLWIMRYKLALFGHIAHRDQLQKRCRVCGSLLMPKGKKKRPSYQCSEFADSLLRVFCISIGNDLPGIHPESFCYSCKQVIERSRTHYSSTTIVQWEKHVEETCKVP